MKITTNKPQTKFQPVTISMTFKSQEELDCMGTLFNTCVISDYLKDDGGIYDPIYQSFEIAGANIYNTDKVMNSIKNHITVRRYK